MLVVRNIFASEIAHPLILGIVADKLLGDGWVQWEVPAIRDTIALKGFAPISELNLNKLLAVATLRASVGPWQEHEAFENVALALTNNIPNFLITQPLSLSQMYAAVDMMDRAVEDKDLKIFSPEVLSYMAACAQFEEVEYLPETLSIIQDRVAPVMYECQDCGNVDIDDLEDGQCDLCVGRFEQDRPTFTADARLKDRGKNIRKYREVDILPISKRLKEARNIGVRLRLDFNPVDIQVAKLLDAMEYRDRKRHEYTTQYSRIRDWLAKRS